MTDALLPELRGPFGRLKPIAGSLAIAFGLSLAPTTYAATFTVTTLSDSGAGSLRAAIALANATPGADTINFAVTGTIALTSGELDITESVTITGPGAASLTIAPANGFGGFYLEAGTATATISGLTIQRFGGTSPNNGGAIASSAGALTVQDCVISGNQVSDSVGGALYNYAGALTVANTTFTGNVGQEGGAIYNDHGTVSIAGSTFSGNRAAGGPGGAVFSRTGNVSIQNSTFSANTASFNGGAVYIDHGTATIANSTFSGNISTGGHGGAVALYDATVNIVSTILAHSTESGGTGDLFSNFYYDGDPPVQVTNSGRAAKRAQHVSTISGSRHARTKALHVHEKAGPVGTFNASNSLIMNPAGFLNGTNINNIIGVDPALGPLANNGGPTLTFALQTGSPALNAGSNPNALPFDQRGSPFLRTVGSQTDIGAFEAQSIAPPPPPPVQTLAPIPTLSVWGTMVLSLLTGIWAAVTGFGRRRR